MCARKYGTRAPVCRFETEKTVAVAFLRSRRLGDWNLLWVMVRYSEARVYVRARTTFTPSNTPTDYFTLRTTVKTVAISCRFDRGRRGGGGYVLVSVTIETTARRRHSLPCPTDENVSVKYVRHTNSSGVGEHYTRVTIQSGSDFIPGRRSEHLPRVAPVSYPPLPATLKTN